MYPRLLKIPIDSSNSFFLFGPRGTGKTLWIKTNFPDAIYLDLLSSNVYKKLLADPSSLENLIPPNFSDWILIDEVQRVPELLNEVHRLIELKGYKFGLTGSSARGLRKKGVNLLAGRAHTYKMHPMTYAEITADFNLNAVMQYGLLPKAINNKEANKFLSSYIHTYLREEILQEGLTRNLEAFAQYLESASFSQGQILNVSQVARDSKLNRKVVENYFHILEDLLLASFLPIFSKRAHRQMASHPKFFLFDTGIYRELRPKGILDLPQEIDGAALETLFLQHLMAYNDYLNWNSEIYYWRTVSGLEVDFILYGPKGLYAFEIKRSANISPKDLRGLKAFCEDYPEAKAFLLCGVSQREYYGQIEVAPYLDFLQKLHLL